MSSHRRFTTPTRQPFQRQIQAFDSQLLIGRKRPSCFAVEAITYSGDRNRLGERHKYLSEKGCTTVEGILLRGDIQVSLNLGIEKDELRKRIMEQYAPWGVRELIRDYRKQPFTSDLYLLMRRDDLPEV